jgi:sulfite exporter TauE/SafE
MTKAEKYVLFGLLWAIIGNTSTQDMDKIISWIIAIFLFLMGLFYLNKKE